MTARVWANAREEQVYAIGWDEGYQKSKADCATEDAKAKRRIWRFGIAVTSITLLLIVAAILIWNLALLDKQASVQQACVTSGGVYLDKAETCTWSKEGQR